VKTHENVLINQLTFLVSCLVYLVSESHTACIPCRLTRFNTYVRHYETIPPIRTDFSSPRGRRLARLAIFLRLSQKEARKSIRVSADAVAPLISALIYLGLRSLVRRYPRIGEQPGEMWRMIYSAFYNESHRDFGGNGKTRRGERTRLRWVLTKATASRLW